MQVWIEHGAGLDVHKKKVVACWFDRRGPEPVAIKRTFGTFEWQLQELREWLLESGCTHVAMESTGVYWRPVFNILEGHFEVILGNAQHMANVPGRKTDLNDAEWIATLLRYGLIRPNFVPPAEVRRLRDWTRLRRKLVQLRSSAQARVEKVLQSANVKISSVASELFGVSGRRMLAALAGGVTDPQAIAELSRGRLRNKRDQLRQAIGGSFTAHHANLIKVQLELIDRVERSVCDLQGAIQRLVRDHEKLVALLDTIPGINRVIAIDVLAEIGFSVEPWPTARHLAAWAGLAPGNRESAGKRRRARTRPGNPWIKSILVQAATAAVRTRGSYLKRRFGRLAHRIGERSAYVAIAHELIISVYHVLSRHEPYRPPHEPDPLLIRERKKQQLLRQLRELGVTVTA